MQVGTPYEKVKEMWESEEGIMYVADIESFVRINEGDRYVRAPRRMRVTELKAIAASYSYDSIGASGHLKRKSFLPRWLLDETKRTVHSILFEPHMQPVPGYYNIFDGFIASKLPRLDADDTPIVDFVRDVLAASNAASADFIMKWLAHILKNPMEMTLVAPCFCEIDWEYMQIFFDFIVDEIIGKHYAGVTGAPKHDLLSRFANAHHNRVLVFVKLTYDTRIDKLFTEPTYAYRTKGFPTAIIKPNYLNVAIGLEKGSTAAMRNNQNLVVFKCNGEYDQDRCRVLKHVCQDSAVAASFYNRLMNMDLHGFMPRQAAAALRNAE